jgi:hypothetical protein
MATSKWEVVKEAKDDRVSMLLSYPISPWTNVAAGTNAEVWEPLTSLVVPALDMTRNLSRVARRYLNKSL